MHEKIGKLIGNSTKTINVEKNFEDISPLSGHNIKLSDVPRSMSEVIQSKNITSHFQDQ
jgi:hypothetical protein